MTVEEMLTSDKAILIPKDIAPVLQCDPYTINLMARDCPERLGFPVCRIGSRTKIPRLPFLKMAVLLVPILVMFVSAVIGGIIEEIGNFKSKDCFKDDEAQALLKRVKSE